MGSIDGYGLCAVREIRVCGGARRGKCRGQLLVALLMVCATAASGQTPDQQKQIDSLLDKAVAATTAPEAETSLREAQLCLDSALKHGRDVLAAAYLQAEITRTRGKIRLAAWQQNMPDDGLREQAEKALLDAYQQYKGAVELVRGQQAARQDPRAARPPIPVRPDQLEEYSLRLQYALAWNEYELGLVAADPHQRQRRLTDSVRRFVSHFTATTYRSDPVLAHCFLGQALCLFELGEHADVVEVLKPARPTNTRPDIYQQMVELRVRSYQAMMDHKGAYQAAWEYLVTRPAAQRDAADWRIALSCVRSLIALTAVESGSQLGAQYRTSLETLAKEIESAGQPWRSGLDALLKEMHGDSPLVRVSRARSKFSSKDYAAALAEADQGLAATSRPAEPEGATVADLRFIRAAALWELGRWLDAHREAAGFLKRYPTDPRAEKMAKCALQAGLNALKANPPMEVSEFMRFVESATTNPASTSPASSGSTPTTLPAQTLRAEAAWYGGSVLLDRGRFLEAQPLLQAVPADSPFYLRAQYGLALAGWKVLESSRNRASHPERTQDPAAPTLAALTRFVQAAGRGISDEDRAAAERVVDLGALVADHLIQRDPPDLQRAAKLLDDIESLPQARSRDISRRLALRVEIAILAGGSDPVAPIVQFIAQQRPAAEDLAGVLGQVGKSIARRRQALASRQQSNEARRLTDALLDVYGRLLSQVSASQMAQARQYEAAIHGQLARSLVEFDRQSEAVTHFEWLEKNSPAGLSAAETRNFALACEQAGRHDPAITLWNRLAKSLPAHTEAWYEARYHLIECYHQAGLSDHARDLLDYFLLQNPEIKVGSWRQKFDDLKQALPKRPDRTGGKG